ncbi:hypothetical protein SOCE26_065540 [Sorangium cellulosum]|uniref:Uncharacterized protein n=1 Tax=Sorangium cellulosum TaxID=56 RepID=A0A2L0F0M0_SORCE|nr:hypothetical protein SOCE26_065540 [Sorangium cellulosum]
MNMRAVHRTLRPLVMLAVSPAFCAAVGITVVHAWLDGRRRPPQRRQPDRAASRHQRLRARRQAQL